MRNRPRGSDTLLFAYGAVMNPALSSVQSGAPAVLAVARLRGFRLGFFGYTEIWDGAQESVIESAGGETWGAIYRVSGTTLDLLDAWQGVRLDGGGSYFHYPVAVAATDGTVHDVLLYRKAVMGAPQLPSVAYRDFIAAGAQARGLPAAYVGALRAEPARPARYPVPQGDRRIASIVGSCCG